MADIFISYKSERRPAAEHIAEILADYGYSVWWDYSLVTGRDFGRQIETELRAAKAAVVLWCSLAVDSDWVREEANLAKHLGSLVPTRIEKIDLPLGFTLSQTVDLSTWDGSPQSPNLGPLLRDIGRLVGRAPQPNFDGLERTERAWRRFGAPPLRQFALIDALEPTTTPTMLKSAPAAEAPRKAADPLPAPQPKIEPRPPAAKTPDAAPITATDIGEAIAAAIAVIAFGLILVEATLFLSFAFLGKAGNLTQAADLLWEQDSGSTHLFVILFIAVTVGLRFVLDYSRPGWRNGWRTLIAAIPIVAALAFVVTQASPDFIKLSFATALLVFLIYCHFLADNVHKGLLASAARRRG